jgi:hypothetical protein
MAESLTGWATGRFGLFHVAAEAVPRPAFNAAGVALALASLGFLAGVGSAVADGSDQAPPPALSLQAAGAAGGGAGLGEALLAAPPPEPPGGEAAAKAGAGAGAGGGGGGGPGL